MLTHCSIIIQSSFVALLYETKANKCTKTSSDIIEYFSLFN